MANTETILKEIIKKIRVYENGPTSDLLIKYGLKYKSVFGVSIIDINKIASQYSPNHELAILLRTKDYRETHLLATLLDELTIDDFNYIIEVVNQINNIELAEQLVFNQLSKLDFSLNLAKELIKSDKEFVISTAYILLSSFIIKKKDISESDFDFFVGFLKRDISNESLHVKRSIARGFRQIAGLNNLYKNKVIDLFEIIKSEGNSNFDFLYEEVVPLIKYS